MARPATATPVELDRREQEGYPFFEDYVRTPSGETTDIKADLFLPDAWLGDERAARTD